MWKTLANCALGNPDDLRLDEMAERVRTVLREEWRKTREVGEELGEPLPGPEQVRVALICQADKGDIGRDPPIGQPASGRTIKWRRKASPPANE